MQLASHSCDREYHIQAITKSTIVKKMLKKTLMTFHSASLVGSGVLRKRPYMRSPS
jgi:hypothetical protein